MQKNTKLELTWVGKEKEINVEPRILIEDKAFSNTSEDRNTKNMLIHGDNLLALKALEQDFSGQIKCIYIDPPYNISAATPYYDDSLENSQWLNLMKPRIELLWSLLTTDGLLAVQIDDEQFARLFLLMEEICSQKNMKIICVKMSEPTGVKMASVNKAGSIPKLKEFIILAKKNGINNLELEKIPKEKWDNEYRTYVCNITDMELGEIKKYLQGENNLTEEEADEILKKVEFKSIMEIAKMQGHEKPTEEWCYDNAGKIVQFATLTGGARDLAEHKKLSGFLFGAFTIETKTGKRYAIKAEFNHMTKLPRCKLLFSDQYLTVNPGDLWTDIKTTGLDNEGVVDFPNGKKPEKLIKRIIKMNTKKGDLVLDSFLGSGTTAAVAHKMGRRWIGIEMGDHAYTHAKFRLDKVIDGSDQGGISKAVNWNGGGGYRFYELAPTLIKEDAFGQAIINPDYNAEMLVAGISKHEGYFYNPDKDVFWKQAKNGVSSYLYVTTNHVTHRLLETILSDMQDDEFCLIVCKSYDANCSNFSKRISIKKIPQSLLKNCEFGKDDYSLNIISPPEYEE
ncbi:MAG: site-specific DNA-methyltransferase [Christensenellales bacterium]|jgi:adenine-specific DNA-methyltransferase|nr:site-specific DNA-methyltransferase [Clostridiales bacterium]